MLEKLSFTTKAPIRLAALKHVMSNLPTRLFSLKGIVYSAEEPHSKLEIQVVGGHATITSTSGWADQTPQTKLVLIARHGSCNFDALEKALKSCESEVDKS